MKKVLLSLAAVGSAVSANAQLLNYGFETSDILPGSLVTENWYAAATETEGAKYENFQNCQCILPSAGTGVDASNSLWVSTDVTGNAWERVVAFTNTGIAENKSYRISLWVKGEGDFNVALLKGCFNHDLALQAGNGSTLTDQTKTFSAANNDEFVRYSYVVWSPSRDVMKSKKADFEQDEYWNQDFLRLAFTGIGNYSVDNVKIEESAVAGVYCNGTAIRVDFGYATNGSELAAAAGGTLVLDPSCVSVKIGGEPAGVESVEIKSDGQFYIFLDENSYIDESSEVSVSFTNPGDLKYSTNVAPESFDNPNAAVYSFTDEQGYFAADLIATSVAWEEAALTTSNPEDNSFEWDGSISEFTFTFNKPVWSNAPENGKPTATLSGQSIEEELQVVEFEGCQNTLTFKRADGAAALANGVYSISVDNVSNEKDVATTTPSVISFEVGKVVASRTIYTLLVDGQVGSDVAPLAGWNINNEGEARNGGESYSSGPRKFDFSGSTVNHALYFRTGFADNGEAGVGSVTFGEVEGAEMTLPAGEIEFRAILAAWKTAGFDVKVELLNAADNSVAAEKVVTLSASAGGATSSIEFQKEAIRFNCAGGKFFFKVSIVDGSAQREALCGGYEVCSYEETAGVRVENEELAVGKFSESGNGYIPPYGSGWRIHRNTDTVRDPGANGGWGGNDASGGQGGPRVFDLSYKNMGGKGIYLDGTTSILTYGEFDTYETTENDETVTKDELTLTLPASKVQITFYTALWKAEGVKYYFQIIPQEEGFKGTPVYEKSEVIKTASPGGNASDGSIEAMQTQFFFTAPAEGKYILRWHTDGEAFVGNISVVAIGSMPAQYKNNLADALDPAKEELGIAMENDLYAGTTRDALSSAITKYSAEDLDFHTDHEYNDAIADLAQLVKAMAARRANINDYASKLDALQTSVNETAEKYQALEAYSQAVQLLADFGEVAPETLDDAKLAEAVSSIDFTAQYLKNMAGDCTNFLTAQIDSLVSAIIDLNDELDANEIVVAAKKALTDDQELVKALKYLYVGHICKQISEGKDFFNTFDEESQQSYPDSIDMSFMIQNRNFYTDAKKQSTGALANTESFPGWDISIVQNSILADWGWGGSYDCTDVRPISDAAVCTAWGTSEIYVSQKVGFLPAGSFTASIKVGDGTSTDSVSLSYAFVNTAALNDTIIVDNDGGSRNAVAKQFRGVVADVDDETSTASLTIGAALRSRGDFSKCDDAALYMTAKVEGFDYAAAAIKLLQLAAEDIQTVERTDAPVSVTYIDLTGRKAAASGLKVKIERYSDGYTVVKKVIE